MRSFKQPIRVRTRGTLTHLWNMDRADHLDHIRTDTKRTIRRWVHDPHGMVDYWAAVLDRVIFPHRQNSHFRWLLIVFLTLFLLSSISARIYIAFLVGGFSGFLDLPLVIVAIVWALLVSFEMGQEVNSISIHDFVSVDFDADSDSDSDKTNE